MNTQGIRISDPEPLDSGGLSDILKEISIGARLKWAILYLYVNGPIEGESVPEFEKKINKSVNGLLINWYEINNLASKIFQIIDIVIIGCKDLSLLHHYDTDQEMYETCDIVIEKEDAVLNGVIFQLPLSDLLILSKREVGYNLIPVAAMRWHDAIDGKKELEIFIAYTFQAPNYNGEGIRYTNANINPIPGYFNFLQKGLNLVGDDFKAMWWATTYLADQKTVVTELPYRIIDLKAHEVQ